MPRTEPEEPEDDDELEAPEPDEHETRFRTLMNSVLDERDAKAAKTRTRTGTGAPRKTAETTPKKRTEPKKPNIFNWLFGG